MMHGRGKSDFAIVAVKLANKVERSAAELVEPRAETKGNVGQQSTRRTQSRISVSKAVLCVPFQPGFLRQSSTRVQRQFAPPSSECLLLASAPRRRESQWRIE